MPAYITIRGNFTYTITHGTKITRTTEKNQNESIGKSVIGHKGNLIESFRELGYHEYDLVKANRSLIWKDAIEFFIQNKKRKQTKIAIISITRGSRQEIIIDRLADTLYLDTEKESLFAVNTLEMKEIASEGTKATKRPYYDITNKLRFITPEYEEEKKKEDDKSDEKEYKYESQREQLISLGIRADKRRAEKNRLTGNIDIDTKNAITYIKRPEEGSYLLALLQTCLLARKGDIITANGEQKELYMVIPRTPSTEKIARKNMQLVRVTQAKTADDMVLYQHAINNISTRSKISIATNIAKKLITKPKTYFNNKIANTIARGLRFIPAMTQTLGTVIAQQIRQSGQKNGKPLTQLESSIAHFLDDPETQKRLEIGNGKRYIQEKIDKYEREDDKARRTNLAIANTKNRNIKAIKQAHTNLIDKEDMEEAINIVEQTEILEQTTQQEHEITYWNWGIAYGGLAITIYLTNRYSPFKGIRKDTTTREVIHHYHTEKQKENRQGETNINAKEEVEIYTQKQRNILIIGGAIIGAMMVMFLLGGGNTPITPSRKKRKTKKKK